MRLPQSLGAKAVAGASLLLRLFPFSFHSIGSNMVAPAEVGVATVVISITTSIGVLLLLSPPTPVSRLLLSLTLG